MKRFELGKSYECRSACDHECVWTYIIKGRTEKTITVEDEDGKVFKLRINKESSEWRKAETVYPLGKYSMCPVLHA